MKKFVRLRLFLLILLLTISHIGFSQTKIEMQVEGKKYKNTKTGLIAQYGYISSLNTYGVTITNKNGVKFYFINCDKYIASDELSMTLKSCFNPDDGSGVGVVYVYPRRIVIQSSDVRLEYELIN